MGFNQRVDREGVPCLVQRMKFWYGDMTIEILFFNGKTHSFPVELFDGEPGVGLLQQFPTRMQWLEIENNVNKMAEKRFTQWFPEDRFRLVAK